MFDSDDNVEKGKMSFLDHLDELRKRLVYCAIAIAVFFGVSWFFSDKIYDFLQKPVLESIHRSNVELYKHSQTAANVPPKEGESIQYTFQFQQELKGAMIPQGSSIQAVVKKGPDGKLYLATAQPWRLGTNIEIPADTPLPTNIGEGGYSIEERLVIDTVAGGFNLYVKVSFYCAIFLSVPFLLYQIWSFISPGLYPHERSYVRPVVALGTVFFLLGAAFAYKIAFPRACDYLIHLSAENFRPLIHANDYFDLITTILLGLGVVFQIPTLTFILARIGLVTPRFLLRFWRFAVVGIVILAGLLTPTPDAANMMVFALPMFLLYFLSVGIAWMFGKPRRSARNTTEVAEAS
ncbi:MAG TPA: twin-arginine translocase subunit TatC [Blastocatellia bacterium]|nr:twin-arginine translocase subunit TatC [Blastocatellia bacterium]